MGAAQAASPLVRDPETRWGPWRLMLSLMHLRRPWNVVLPWKWDVGWGHQERWTEAQTAPTTPVKHHYLLCPPAEETARALD